MPAARIVVIQSRHATFPHLLGQGCLVMYQGDLLQADDGKLNRQLSISPRQRAVMALLASVLRSEVTVREAKVGPLLGGLIGWEPSKLEAARLTWLRVLDGPAKPPPAFPGGALVMVIEVAGVQFAERAPMRAVVLERALLRAV